MDVRYLFFDFGGCIDAPGIHTRVLFWQAFARLGLVDESQKQAFQEAYSLADKQMMASGEAKELHLAPFNRWNGALIADFLRLEKSKGEAAGVAVTKEMVAYLEESRAVLRKLSQEFPLGIISNFTGNLECILEEFSLRELFSSVTESFYEGCSKPDLRIFRSALAKQNFPAEQCLYVGDNPVNDIAPAKSLGMKAVLIHPPGSRKECGADGYVERLEDLRAILQRS